MKKFIWLIAISAVYPFDRMRSFEMFCKKVIGNGDDEWKEFEDDKPLYNEIKKAFSPSTFIGKIFMFAVIILLAVVAVNILLILKFVL